MSRGLDALTQSWIGGALSGHYPPEKILACFPPDRAFPPRWRDLAGYIREVVARGRLPSLAELPPEQISLAAEAQRAHFQDAALLDDLYHSILSLWRAEEIRRLATDVGRTAYEGGDLLGALDRLSSFIREGSHTLPADDPENLLRGYLESLGKDPPKPLFRSGLPPLDYVLDFTPGSLITLGARTSAGKTAFSIHLARQAAKAGVPTVYYTTEMTPEQLLLRILAQALGLDLRKLFRREVTLEELVPEKAFAYVRSLPISIVHTSSPEAVLRDLATRFYRGEARLAIVDFVQDLRFDVGDHYRMMIGRFAKDCKELSVSTGSVVLLVAQLNREAVNVKGKAIQTTRPALHHLKETGHLEESSDAVLLLWRKPDENGVYTSEAELIVAKNRHGPLGYIPLAFAGETGRFQAMGYTV